MFDTFIFWAFATIFALSIIIPCIIFMWLLAAIA